MPVRRSTLAAALLSTAVAGAADFPSVDKLPRRAGLPDPLVCLDGKRITTAKEWREVRRPELTALFGHYMYGFAPPAPDKVTAKVERIDREALGGKATLKEITLAFGGPKVPRIHLLLVVPNDREGPAPTFVGLNFAGNHTLVKDPKVRLPTAWMPGRYPHVKDNKATDAGRGVRADVWALDQAAARGYAVATCYCGDIDPDKPDFDDGVHPHYRKAGGKPGPHEWGTIAAWAWGLSRIVDYLVTDKDIDKTRLAVVGHSRLGKTALLAAALDERFALSIPHQAGCGGSAPSRGKVGESVKQINDRFPHWFNDTFPLFNEQVERLPFDQNGLVALVAPRPVLFSNAKEDSWANPDGQFEVLKAADGVYRLLGVEGLGAKSVPPVGKLLDSRLGYYIRPGRHSMTRGDWKVFLDFADKHLAR